MPQIPQTDDLVVASLDAQILTLTLNRPAKLNAHTGPMLAALRRGLERARDEDVRVVVLRGEGRSFCAGSDVQESLGMADLDEAAAYLTDIADLLAAISNLPKPVIAAVQGNAVGGGAEIALEADIRIVSDDARMAFPDAPLGSTPASVYRLVRMVGPSRAATMAMLGEPLDAPLMLELGVAFQMVPRDQLDAAARTVAERLRDEVTARSLRFAKDALIHAQSSSRQADLKANIASMLVCHASDRQREYIREFQGQKS